MTRKAKIHLIPLNATCELEPGSPLEDALFGFGVEFPCGGNGLCRGCRIRVKKGDLPVAAGEKDLLSRAEIDAGWRLACFQKVRGDLTLELPEQGLSILSDEREHRFTPCEGFAVAVDLGTTTIVAQLIDLTCGRVIGVVTALNPQARFGSDIMSRIDHAVNQAGEGKLRSLVRGEIGRMIDTLCRLQQCEGGRVRKIVLAGNTVMHHLFCAIPLAPLAAYPFETPHTSLQAFRASDLGWDLADNPPVEFLPCLGSFVGSDLLAGIEAIGLHEKEETSLLVDLGTNGEIAAGNRDRIVCASTAAGPAFEGGSIAMGMRAAPGAVSAVRLEEGALSCRVIGGGAPCGICGSGLVDAVAAGLELGKIDPSGRVAAGDRSISLTPPVAITQRDIREVQLAKGAVAAGIRIVLEHLGLPAGELHRLFLAGAFGNYINRDAARRIGMIRSPCEKIFSAGNTALLGTKIALFQSMTGQRPLDALCEKVEHISLSRHPRFQEIFAEEMLFPDRGEVRI